MNANELADGIESCTTDPLHKEAATMLRILDGQLAFRIDSVSKYQAWVKELEISKQSWEIIAKGYGKTIDEQQAEIEALKKEAALQRLSDFTQEAECKHGVDDGACKECYQDATEPVAWAYIKDGEFWDAIHPDEHAQEEGSYTIPFYTHPVKELTDEEIEEFEWLIKKQFNFPTGEKVVGLDRIIKAILRKAQEK